MSTPDASLPSLPELAGLIDHALLHPTMTDEQTRAGLALARRWGCATACVKPCDVPLAAHALTGSGVKVCAVVGFPHGNSHPETIAGEAVRAIQEGAAEVDMVVNAGRVLSGDWDFISAAVKRVNDACMKQGAILKVIFENDYLEDALIIRLCEICTQHGVAFIKTSTGFGFVRQASGDYNTRGATDRHLRLMRQHAGPHVQIKAAGGIRTLDDLLRARSLGVTRIGASATEAILTEAVKRGCPGPSPQATPADNASPAAQQGY